MWDHGGADAGGDRGYDGQGVEEIILLFIRRNAAPFYGSGIFHCIDGLVSRDGLVISAIAVEVIPVMTEVMAIETEVTAIVANIHPVIT
jgi:hypothetical protein